MAADSMTTRRGIRAGSAIMTGILAAAVSVLAACGGLDPFPQSSQVKSAGPDVLTKTSTESLSLTANANLVVMGNGGSRSVSFVFSELATTVSPTINADGTFQYSGSLTCSSSVGGTVSGAINGQVGFQEGSYGTNAGFTVVTGLITSTQLNISAMAAEPVNVTTSDGYDQKSGECLSQFSAADRQHMVDDWIDAADHFLKFQPCSGLEVYGYCLSIPTIL